MSSRDVHSTDADGNAGEVKTPKFPDERTSFPVGERRRDGSDIMGAVLLVVILRLRRRFGRRLNGFFVICCVLLHDGQVVDGRWTLSCWVEGVSSRQNGEDVGVGCPFGRGTVGWLFHTATGWNSATRRR